MTASRAYAEVERLTRRRARNFAYGIMVLPRDKRRAIAAIYAFARRVDDIADGELSVVEKRAQLEQLRGALDAAPGEDAMLVALADARTRFPIPEHALHALVDGGLQDLEQSRYADFDELRAYCSKVAGAVGLACVAVYGSEDVERAETLGIALQLINIIRDVAEDWNLGRVYIPQDELASFGVTEDDIAAGRATDAWRTLMTFQAERARACLQDGQIGAKGAATRYAKLRPCWYHRSAAGWDDKTARSRSRLRRAGRLWHIPAAPWPETRVAGR